MNPLLDWIALAYTWFYCKFLQRPREQPFTAQADRMERRWPYLVYGIALAIFLCVDRFLHGWWLAITVIVNLFALWFLPHINSYQRKHPENVPYSFTNRAVKWAAERIRKRGWNDN
jgi:hypothetical protein